MAINGEGEKNVVYNAVEQKSIQMKKNELQNLRLVLNEAVDRAGYNLFIK